MKKVLPLVFGVCIALAFFGSAVHAATTPPTSIVKTYSAWRKSAVKTARGTFPINVVTVNLLNPKLHAYTLTGNANDCKNNCMVSPLKAYVDRVKGFAGINGTYFCPSTYASCVGQTGSYYWMVYNSVRRTFVNIHQNKFNRGPLVAFDTENHWHFYREARDWSGLAAFEAQYQTHLTALISNGPTLVIDRKLTVTASELDTKQRTAKGPRGSLAFKGTNAYLIIASNATVLDLGAVVKAMGMEYAINLDGGGSSALIFDGQYRVGPGRNIPNALIFSEK